MSSPYRIGVDENGLGAWLGPLVVTAVLARVRDGAGAVVDGRLPAAVARDLDDSKRLVSHSDVRLGEAWARALALPEACTPDELFHRLSLESAGELRAPCPRRVQAQCWGSADEAFTASDAVCSRVRDHLRALADLGLEVQCVRTTVTCTRRLNEALAQGRSRFTVDLHSMERLVLALREHAGQDVHAVCGKVGGIGDYTRFFGPLAGRLHVVLDQGAERSTYRIPGLGQIAFVRDADAHDALVMLASLVGKYVRELLMGRIARRHALPDDEPAPSGYHDPRTARFVERTAELRARRRVPATCFERERARRG